MLILSVAHWLATCQAHPWWLDPYLIQHFCSFNYTISSTTMSCLTNMSFISPIISVLPILTIPEICPARQTTKGTVTEFFLTTFIICCNNEYATPHSQYVQTYSTTVLDMKLSLTTSNTKQTKIKTRIKHAIVTWRQALLSSLGTNTRNGDLRAADNQQVVTGNNLLYNLLIGEQKYECPSREIHRKKITAGS